MDLPKIAGTGPISIELDPGDYYWCACGLSADQPFCDGSHKSTDIRPQQFSLAEKRRVSLCICKHSNKAPFCDGTHKGL